MSDDLFEIAFSGQIIEGADPAQVKRQIGQIFKADATRLEQLFSGRRVVIKRQADEATANKYRAAFHRAGAICDIRSLNSRTSNEALNPQPQKDAAHQPYESKYPESDMVPQALLSDPLGISAESIEALNVDIAPVGSPMQHQIKETPQPSIDIGDLEIAPVGSTLSSAQQKELPPVPDTSGLSLAD